MAINWGNLSEREHRWINARSSFSSRRERFVSSSPFLIPFLIVSHSPRKITERSTEPISTFFYLPSTMYIRWPVLKFLEIPQRLDYSSSIFFFRSRSSWWSFVIHARIYDHVRWINRQIMLQGKAESNSWRGEACWISRRIRRSSASTYFSYSCTIEPRFGGYVCC